MHPICPCTDDENFSNIDITTFRAFNSKPFGITGDSLHTNMHPNILRTCREIHEEAIPLLYGLNTFTVHPALLSGVMWHTHPDRPLKDSIYLEHIRHFRVQLYLPLCPIGVPGAIAKLFSRAETLYVDVSHRGTSSTSEAFRNLNHPGYYRILLEWAKIRGVGNAKFNGSPCQGAISAWHNRFFEDDLSDDFPENDLNQDFCRWMESCMMTEVGKEAPGVNPDPNPKLKFGKRTYEKCPYLASVDELPKYFCRLPGYKYYIPCSEEEFEKYGVDNGYTSEESEESDGQYGEEHGEENGEEQGEEQGEEHGEHESERPVENHCEDYDDEHSWGDPYDEEYAWDGQCDETRPEGIL